MSNHRSTTNQPSNQVGAAKMYQEPHSVEDIRYFIEGYVLHHKSQRHSPRTIEFHTDRLGRFVWFLEHQGYPTALEQITTNHLRHFLIYLAEQKEGRWGSNQAMANHPMSQSTIHSYA